MDCDNRSGGNAIGGYLLCKLISIFYLNIIIYTVVFCRYNLNDKHFSEFSIAPSSVYLPMLYMIMQFRILYKKYTSAQWFSFLGLKLIPRDTYHQHIDQTNSVSYNVFADDWLCANPSLNIDTKSFFK